MIPPAALALRRNRRAHQSADDRPAHRFGLMSNALPKGLARRPTARAGPMG